MQKGIGDLREDFMLLENGHLKGTASVFCLWKVVIDHDNVMSGHLSIHT